MTATFTLHAQRVMIVHFVTVKQHWVLKLFVLCGIKDDVTGENINGSSTPCYLENQPGGCYKPHCAFLHQKSRGNVKTQNKKCKSKENNFGIKTLEQIRMEKIHKESEHIYKSGASRKKILGLRNKKDDSLDFKIKTLDEIRKERENKSGKRKEIDSIVPARYNKYLKTASSFVSSNSNDLPPSTKEIQNSSINNDKSVKKICFPVIKRMCLTSPQLPIANSSISVKDSQNNSDSVSAVENSPDCPVVKSISLSKAYVSNGPKENNISPVSAIKDCSNVKIHERHPVYSSTSPVDTDKKAAWTSVDEIEKHLNGVISSDCNINFGDVEGTASNERESEDFVLEIEMFIRRVRFGL